MATVTVRNTAGRARVTLRKRRISREDAMQPATPRKDPVQQVLHPRVDWCSSAARDPCSTQRFDDRSPAPYVLRSLKSLRLKRKGRHLRRREAAGWCAGLATPSSSPVDRRSSAPTFASTSRSLRERGQHAVRRRVTLVLVRGRPQATVSQTCAYDAHGNRVRQLASNRFTDRRRRSAGGPGSRTMSWRPGTRPRSGQPCRWSS